MISIIPYTVYILSQMASRGFVHVRPQFSYSNLRPPSLQPLRSRVLSHLFVSLVILICLEFKTQKYACRLCVSTHTNLSVQPLASHNLVARFSMFSSLIASKISHLLAFHLHCVLRGLNGTGEMHDAAEVLEEIFACFKTVPEGIGVVDGTFGTKVEVRLHCHKCRKYSHELQYTEHFHNAQATELRTKAADQEVAELGPLLRKIHKETKRNCNAKGGYHLTSHMQMGSLSVMDKAMCLIRARPGWEWSHDAHPSCLLPCRTGLPRGCGNCRSRGLCAPFDLDKLNINLLHSVPKTACQMII